MSNPLRKTLEFLGLAEESYDDAPQRSVSQQVAQQVAQPVAQRATVTPLRRGSKSQGISDVNEILTVHPKKYDDARVIAETFREGIPVIINLTQMSEAEARRLVDFASRLIETKLVHLLLNKPASGGCNRPIDDGGASGAPLWALLIC